MLKPVHFPLDGFSGESVMAEGVVELPVLLGTSPKETNIVAKFVVIKKPSAYNVILGSPTLNAVKAIISTPHLKMKFPMPGGIGEVRGDQSMARRCYYTATT